MMKSKKKISPKPLTQKEKDAFSNTLYSMAKEICHMVDYKEDLTLKQKMHRLYKIMRKYGIKKHTKVKGQIGMTGARFDYSACIAMMQYFTKDTLLMALMQAPKDIDVKVVSKPKP